MNTSKKIRNIVGISIVSGSLIFGLSGCQKDELISPSLNSVGTPVSMNSNGSSKTILSDNRNTEGDLAIVTIKHEPGFSRITQSFEVTLYNSGEVIFQGVSGVTHIGDFKYKIDPTDVQRVKDIMNERIYLIRDNLIRAVDEPEVVTTYQRAADISPISLVDDNISYPEGLIDLRKVVENILKDSFYISGDKNSVSPYDEKY